MKKIIPAILTNNVKELKEKLSQVENLSDWVQIDFADNDFVANQTIKVLDLAEIKTNLNLEAHLMVNNPADWFNDCAKVGFKRVIFHIEAKEDLEYTLHAASLYDFEIGIALNPDSKVELIAPVIDKINSVLLMGVNPGFSGQKFIPEVLNKVSDIRKISDGVMAE
ncbi:MAG: ribulose-phosphate 3-epimerase [Candidatus Falkowbacteria bacterium]|nr:ribulose-phosphate 3-epimerase [Candidatus Falkowbacteria bacterium]